VQTNFKEFMKDCHASLILPENALIIARKTSSVVVANPVSRLADDPDAIVALGPVTVIAGQRTHPRRLAHDLAKKIKASPIDEFRMPPGCGLF
jgi:hypothetical protein